MTPMVPEAILVFFGGSLQKLTNGRWRSGRHRVIAGGASRRRSTGFFYGPPLDVVISPLPGRAPSSTPGPAPSVQQALGPGLVFETRHAPLLEQDARSDRAGAAEPGGQDLELGALLDQLDVLEGAQQAVATPHDGSATGAVQGPLRGQAAGRFDRGPGF